MTQLGLSREEQAEFAKLADGRTIMSTARRIKQAADAISDDAAAIVRSAECGAWDSAAKLSARLPYLTGNLERARAGLAMAIMEINQRGADVDG